MLKDGLCRSVFSDATVSFWNVLVCSTHNESLKLRSRGVKKMVPLCDIRMGWVHRRSNLLHSIKLRERYPPQKFQRYGSPVVLVWRAFCTWGLLRYANILFLRHGSPLVLWASCSHQNLITSWDKKIKIKKPKFYTCLQNIQNLCIVW